MKDQVPPELLSEINRAVFDQIDGLSAHSDLSHELLIAVKPLGDVQMFTPDRGSYRYVVVSTKGVIFGFAIGMERLAFRLDEKMKQRAIETGGEPYSICGDDWISFELFRADWPKVDLEFWARKAYVAIRERVE
jgi:hypothetical protein